MDWKMPDMDGWEACRQIRELARRHDLPQPIVIMVTAHGREMLIQRTEDEQALINGFLVKPITSQQFHEALVEAQSGNTGIRKLTAGRSNARQLSGMRVLVVEDNLINQQVAEELLTAEGALVSLAANGQLGVEAVARATPQFDVVLMDIQMPVLDGYGATRAIREDLRLQTLPIVAMTANAAASDRDACLSVGMTEHIGKPFDIEKLVLLLRKLKGLSLAAPVLQRADFSEHPEQESQQVLAQQTIDGIDIKTALLRMSGSKSLYTRTARSLAKSLKSSHVEIHRLIEERNSKLVSMALHTLKGNAGTLGLTALALEAKRLEQICKSQDGVSHLLSELDALKFHIDQGRSLLDQAILLLQEDSPKPAAMP